MYMYNVNREKLGSGDAKSQSVTSLVYTDNNILSGHNVKHRSYVSVFVWYNTSQLDNNEMIMHQILSQMVEIILK